MLVGLPNRDIAKYWSTFEEIIRKAIPSSPRQLPDRLQRMFYAAMTGQLQLWLMFDPEDGTDTFYGGMITKKVVDDLTGESSLLIYALYNFKQASRKAREADWAATRRVAREAGCPYISAYCGSRLVAETAIKANKGMGEIIHYCLLNAEAE